MNKYIQDKDPFALEDMSPAGVTIGYSRERSLVNSICIITNDKWTDVVKRYIEQCHFRSNMASYKTCMTDTLRASGFLPCQFGETIQQLLDYCNKSLDNRLRFIIKLSFGYLSIVWAKNLNHYIVKGVWPDKKQSMHMRIEETWFYIPGTDNRTGIKRVSRKKTFNKKENQSLIIKNLNPDDKNVGDCVIRSLSAVYGCSWHEAMDLIAEAIEYTDPILNYRPNTQAALIKLGFSRHKTIQYAREALLGKQFCQYLDHTYSNGERFFAYVGNHHCAAILPIKQNDGSTKYQIQDTWDSTEEPIEEVWIYYPNGITPKNDSTSAPCDNHKDFQTNNKIIHPQFGMGVIVEINNTSSNQIMTINFEKIGLKRISAEWLKANSR